MRILDFSDSLEAVEELAAWKCGGIIVIDPGKEDLLVKIRNRVEEMFDAGLVEEVRVLRGLGFGKAKVVVDGIGYREAGELLDGRISQSEAIKSTVIRTRQYAKRQRTYFKNMGWKTIHPDEFKGLVADRKIGNQS